MNLMSLLDRLKEPSTYAGFAVIAMSFGISSVEWTTYTNVIASIAAAVAMFMSEKSK